MTLTHVVLLKWKPGTPDSAVEPGLKKLEQIPLTETYILSYRIGKDLCVGRTKMNHDVAVVAEFATEDDYHRYATAGKHLDAVDLLKPHLMHRHAVQTHARKNTAHHSRVPAQRGSVSSRSALSGSELFASDAAAPRSSQSLSAAQEDTMSLRGKLETFADTAKKWAGVAWKRGGRVAWVVAATSIVMFLPLVMEIEREGSVIETDKLRIKDFRAQGYTDNQISQMGLSASVEPAVGLAAPASKPLHLQQ